MEIYDKIIDTNGNRKYIFLLRDNALIEASAFMHNEMEHFCVPSQIGCALGCHHCATTYAATSYVGQLLYSDMIAMINYLLQDSPYSIPRILSFAGHGEPMLNWKCIEQTMQYFNETFYTFHLTSVGILKTMDKILLGSTKPTIYFSIHGSCDKERGRVINLENNRQIACINQIISFCNAYTAIGGKCVWNYMAHAENFSQNSIYRLIDLCKTISFPLEIRFTKYIDINVNNKIEEVKWEKIEEALRHFHKYFPSNVHLRISKLEGDASEIACGQLRARILNGGT